jgi:CheY-like chemotaxis protein
METVLLVDDNALRASIRRSALESTATSVVRVSDAAEALCTVETPEMAGAIGLVVTGHQMSGISGPEFVAELRRRMPRVPVLVVNPETGFESEYEGIDGVYFAKNPTAEELHRLADELLAGLAERQTA